MQLEFVYREMLKNNFEPDSQELSITQETRRKHGKLRNVY